MDFLFSMVKKKIVGEQALYNVGHDYTLSKSQFLQLGHIASWGHRILVGSYEMIITIESP